MEKGGGMRKKVGEGVKRVGRMRGGKEINGK